jgi:hypothetical protein
VLDPWGRRFHQRCNRSIAQIFDTIVMTFKSYNMTFESITKIFDAAIMTFESTDMVFNSVFDMIFTPASSGNSTPASSRNLAPASSGNLTLRCQEIRPCVIRKVDNVSSRNSTPPSP